MVLHKLVTCPLSADRLKEHRYTVWQTLQVALVYGTEQKTHTSLCPPSSALSPLPLCPQSSLTLSSNSFSGNPHLLVLCPLFGDKSNHNTSFQSRLKCLQIDCYAYFLLSTVKVGSCNHSSLIRSLSRRLVGDGCALGTSGRESRAPLLGEVTPGAALPPGLWAQPSTVPLSVTSSYNVCAVSSPESEFPVVAGRHWRTPRI